MLQVIPTYRVRYVAVVEPCSGAHERHEHAIEVRVPETQLGAFLDVIRFNRITKFDVEMESGQ